MFTNTKFANTKIAFLTESVGTIVRFMTCNSKALPLQSATRTAGRLPMLRAAVVATFALLVLTSNASAFAEGRQWTDKSGRFAIQGDLVGYDSEQVIIETEKKELVSMLIAELSDEDREYLESKEAVQHLDKIASSPQTWELKNGLKVIGQVMDFVDQPLTIQRRRGDMYFNDRNYENLPEVYQRMVPHVINHFEATELEGEQDIRSWVISLKGRPRSYDIEGVRLQLENGDLYAVPFFFFSAPDQTVLMEGFKRWKAAQQEDDIVKQQSETSQLEAIAQAYARDRERERAEQQRITRLQLALMAAAADVTDMWEVELVPRGNYPWTSTIVVANNSAQAMAIAASKNPNYTIGAVRKLNRSGRFWRRW